MFVQFCLYISCLMILVSPSVAYAQSKREVLALCQDAVATGDNDTAISLANVVQTWTSLFSAELEIGGAECISAATGEKWQYSRATLSFASVAELEAERQNRIAKINARSEMLNSRRCELLGELFPMLARENELQEAIEASQREIQLGIMQAQTETVQACHDWYLRDAMAALTNPVCNSLFLSVGLRPSGGATDAFDELELQYIVGRIEQITSSIAIIDDRQKLPEEVIAEEEERLRGVLIQSLPDHLKDSAQSMSSGEIEIMRIEYELSSCN